MPQEETVIVVRKIPTAQTDSILENVIEAVPPGLEVYVIKATSQIIDLVVGYRGQKANG